VSKCKRKHDAPEKALLAKPGLLLFANVLGGTLCELPCTRCTGCLDESSIRGEFSLVIAFIIFRATTYLTQQERLPDTAPQLLIQKAFESVIFTDSDDTLKSGG
jgi:hypothetical protein